MRKSDLFRKVQIPLLLTAESMPISLLLFGILVPDRMWTVWILPICCAIFAAVCLLLPGKRRILAGAFGSLMLILVGLLVGTWSGCWYLVAFTLLYLFILWVCIPAGGWEWYQELPPVLCYIGILLFIAVQVLVVLIKNLCPGLSELIKNGMTVSFLLFALLVLLLMNRHTLNSAAFNRNRASANVRNKNRMLVVAFFAIVTLIVATPAIWEAVWSVIRWVVRLLMSGDESGVTQLPAETQPPQSGGNLIVDGSETSLFAKVMTWIFLWLSRIVTVLAVPALLLLLAFLLRKWLRKLKKLTEKVSRYLASSSEDYEEEITDIRDSDAVRSLRSRIGSRVSAASERKMPPRERIRYRYGRLLRKHPEWSESHTARENLPEQTAGTYEKARYSKAELTEEEAKQFISDIKRI